MKIKSLVVAIVILFSIKAFSQQSINASGGNASSAAGNISFSVGQVFSKTIYTGNYSVAEGVHQPFEISTLGIDNFSNIILEMKVYPNPTTSVIYLKISGLDLKNLHYQILDVSGRHLLKKIIGQEETTIDLSSRSSGIYILTVSESNKILKTFKIIKN